MCLWLDETREFTLDVGQRNAHAFKQFPGSGTNFAGENEEEVLGTDEGAAMLPAETDRTVDRVPCLLRKRRTRRAGLTDGSLRS